MATKVCPQFLPGVLTGKYRPGDNYKVALLADKKCTCLADCLEVRGEGYASGGVEIGPYLVSERLGAAGSREVVIGFPTDAVWPESTITASAALIYNSSHPENQGLAVIEFENDRVSRNDRFSIFLAGVPLASFITS